MLVVQVSWRLSGDLSRRRRKVFNSSLASQVKSRTSPTLLCRVVLNILSATVKIMYKMLPYISNLGTANVVKTYRTSMDHIIHMRLKYNDDKISFFYSRTAILPYSCSILTNLIMYQVFCQLPPLDNLLPHKFLILGNFWMYLFTMPTQYENLANPWLLNLCMC